MERRFNIVVQWGAVSVAVGIAPRWGDVRRHMVGTPAYTRGLLAYVGRGTADLKSLTALRLR
jgi:hypothetical protein